MKRIAMIVAVGAFWCGCGEPQPIVTGAPRETERSFSQSVSNLVDTSQPVTGSNRGDVVEGRHIPPAAERLTQEKANAK